MRILQCHNFYRFPGGEDQVFHDESWLLKKHGHEVFHYLRDNRDIENMSRIELARATIWNQRTVTDIEALIQELSPELIHFHNTFPLISTSAYHTAKRYQIPIVQTLHNYRMMCPSATLFRNGKECHSCINKTFSIPGIIHKCYRSDRKATAVAAAANAFQRTIKKSLHLVDRFIALSETSRQQFELAGIPRSKIIVKPNFVRPEPKVGNEKGGHVVFVGRLTEEKGIHSLLDAWQAEPGNPISEIPLRIIGQGPQEEKVKRFAAQNPNISYLGQLKHPEVMEQIAQSKLLVFPSIWPEPFGRSMIEAFATGTPVVASTAGSIPEIVQHEVNGLHFEPGNHKNLQDQIMRMFAEPELLVKTSIAARRTYEQRYTADRNHDVLLRTYAEAVESNPSELEICFA